MPAVEGSTPRGGFWLCPKPLILASKSQGRRVALSQTGIPFEVSPAEIDERAIERRILSEGGGADEVVSELARAKALKISADNPRFFVIGADQAASCEQRMFGKPSDLDEAARQLAFLAGRAHRLHSAVALARDGIVLFENISHADIRMRPLERPFINVYLASVGEAALTSAGAYQVEGMGVHLFSAMTGDHWTILGLPLLPILDALRREGALLG